MIGHGSTTTSGDLDKAGKALFRSKWGGVWASDTLPQKLKKPMYYISNTDPSGEVGEHWIGIHRGFVYDSFGRSAKQLSCHLTGRNLRKTDEEPEQDISEQNCGQRSLAWLLVAKKFGIDIASKFV